MVKPSLARGMRDFSSREIAAREYIFDTIRQACVQYGFQPLDTPVIEQMNVLTEKYGEEGDKLLFKILDSGDYLEKVDGDILADRDTRRLTSAIAEKGLRYDLTVPLARYVVMNRNALTFPFKRFQIGKVWRADRPQKGRYREFYQCDADAIGSASLLYDAECVVLLADVLNRLDLPRFEIKINNRKILAGLAESWSFGDRFTEFTVIIDKWDKIGEDGVVRELGTRGFTETQIHRVQSLFRLQGSTDDQFDTLANWMQGNPQGLKGIAELKEVLAYLEKTEIGGGEVKPDFTLARGLDYYTATIFECILPEHAIGSIAAGGRYDELTAAFGLPDMPGVGFSFGAERIFDVLRELNRLPGLDKPTVQVLVINFGGDDEKYAFGILNELHKAQIAAEMYPSAIRMGKQFAFAGKKNIPFALIMGAQEIADKTFALKDLNTGDQTIHSWAELVDILQPPV